MNNTFHFSATGGTFSLPLFFSSLSSSDHKPDPADSLDVEEVTRRLREICFVISCLSRQCQDPHPHCPRNITQFHDECFACQQGEPGHIGDLTQYQATLLQRIQKLEQEKEQCRRFLEKARDL